MNSRTILAIAGTVLLLVIGTYFIVQLRGTTTGLTGSGSPTATATATATAASDPTKFTVQGIVIESGTKAAVANAEILLTQDGQVLAKTTTDPRGVFEIDADRKAQRLRVLARAPGLVPRESSVAGKRMLNIVLSRAVSVAGRIEAAGKPVLGATVRCQSELRIAADGTTTGPDGAFTLGDCAPGRVWIAASHPDFGATLQDLGERAAGARAADVTVALSPGARITGKVLDPDDQPQTDAVVVVFAARAPNKKMDELRQPAAIAPVDAEGRYDAGRLGPGRWDVLTATPDGRATYHELRLRGTEDQTVDLRLPQLSFIAGTVERKGKKVASAMVSMRMQRPESPGPAHLAGELALLPGRLFGNQASTLLRTVTDQSGHFKFNTIPPGSYEATAQHDAGRGTVTLQTGKLDVVVDLAGGGDIRGTITENGEPANVQGQAFAVPVKPGPGMVRPMTQFTGGRFVLQGVPEGEYTVRLFLSAPYQLIPKTVTVKNDLTADVRWTTSEVHKLQISTVKGQVVGPDGAGLDSVRVGVNVTTFIFGGGSQVSATTDKDGHFALTTPQSTGKVVLTHPAFARKEVDYDVGEAKELDLGQIELARSN